jgi:hypothetical protein
MPYIIKHDFNQNVPYYVRVIDKSSFDEVYAPQCASQFDTKTEAQEWIETYSSMKENSSVVDFFESAAEYLQWTNEGTVRRTLSCINRSMSRPYNNEPIDEVIDWWIYQRHNVTKIDYDDYKTWPHLHQVSKHLWEVNAYHSRDYKELYIGFEIYTKPDGNFEEFEREINRVIAKTTYKDEDGYLIFPIFDHFLSEHGNSVYLLIHPKSKEVKISGCYSYNNSEFPSLEKAFEYIKANRYYN